MINSPFFKVNSNFTCFWVVSVILLLPLARGGTLIWPQVLAILIIAVLCIFLVLFNDFSEFKQQSYWLLPWMVLSAIIIIQLIPFKPLDLTETDPFKIKNRISAMPGETIGYWAIFTLYWIVAWIVSNLSKSRIVFIACCILGLLLFEIIYGMIAYVNSHEKILGIWQVDRYTKNLSGTFVNRNHFAAMLEVASPLVLSLLILPKVFSIRINRPIKIMFAVFFLLSSLLALFNTHSRLGIVCYLIAMIIWIGLITRNLDHSVGRKRVSLYIFYFLSFSFLLALWLGLEPLANRFQDVGEDARFLFWRAAVESFPQSYWLWGIGAGSLVDNFRLIAPLEISNRVVYQLHNDWLEFLLNFGIPGAILIGLSFVIWYRKCRAMKYSVLHLGALAGVIAIAIHSFGEFSLQIPGVAILFWTMVGIIMNKNLVKILQ